MSHPLGLHLLPGRCPEGYAAVQHPRFCRCPIFGGTDWQVFVRVLGSVKRSDGTVHQRDVRPLIAGRIGPRTVGQLYSRAKREGLLTEVGTERSNDVAGKNAGRHEPYYRLSVRAVA